MMLSTGSTFALIGRAFPSESFRDLHQVSVAARAERKTRRTDRIARTWTVVRGPIVLPKLLSA